MASHFAKLPEAKKEYEKRTGIKYDLATTALNGTKIFNRNRNRRNKKKLKRPYFVGTYMEWLNI